MARHPAVGLRIWFLRVATLCLTLASISLPSMAQEPVAAPKVEPVVDPTVARYLKALETRGNWTYVEAPLSDVAKELSDKLDIGVLIDVRALNDVGLVADLPVSIYLRNVKARTLLDCFLRELDLTWMIRDEALVITTLEQAEAELATRIYPVADLVRKQDDGLSSSDWLIGLLTSIVSPASWQEVGGPATADELYGLLVVSQTEEAHNEIRGLLGDLRTLHRAKTDGKGGVTEVIVGQQDQEAVRKALSQKTELTAIETPLEEVVEHLRDLTGVNILIDQRALDDVGLSPEVPITSQFKGIPLRVGMRRLLREFDLTYMVRGEVIFITTPEEAEANLQTRLFPVHDLPSTGFSTNQPYERLMEVISTTVEPESWDEVGGPGAVISVVKPPVLVVSQTEEVQRQVGELLARIREARRLTGAAGKTSPADERYLRVYRLHAKEEGQTPPDGEDVVRLIGRVVEPDNWAEPRCVLDSLEDAVVVRHSHEVHEKVQRLLRELGVWSHGNGQPGLGGGGGGFGGGGLFGGAFGAGGPGGGGLSGGGGGLPAMDSDAGLRTEKAGENVVRPPGKPRRGETITGNADENPFGRTPPKNPFSSGSNGNPFSDPDPFPTDAANPSGS